MSGENGGRFDLSRRTLLGAVGTIGGAAALGGAGSMAFFSDDEQFANNQLTAGELDLKVAVSQHYVDWLPDTPTAGDVDSPSPQETDDASMPEGDEDADLTLNPGAAGRGDTAANPIELSISDAPGLASGSLVNSINGGVPLSTDDTSLCGEDSERGGDDDDAERPIIDLGDVKPGDFGFVRFEFASCDNPAFVEIFGELESASENGVTEPEADDEDEDQNEDGSLKSGSGDPEVELLDEVQLALLGDDVATMLDGSVEIDSGDGFAGTSPVTLGTLQRADGRITEPLEGDIDPETGGGTGNRNCFSGATDHRRTLVWWLPVDHANEIQTDSATFSLGIAAEQCRHNDGSIGSDPVVLESDATGGIRETDSWITATVEPGPVTTVTVELDGEVYGDDSGEWPSNASSYVMEVNIDAGTDGIDEAANDDDFRFGYAGANSGARANAIASSGSASGAGGYLRRNTGASGSGSSPSRVDVAAEELDGFTASESSDQLTYTFEIDWNAVANDSDADLDSPPSEIQVNEVFGSDGGEGVGATPNSSNDGRGDIDNVADSSGTLSTGL
jgi:predicted ribosomally synthesized peptide with SipW-like signal peptide